MHVHVKVHAQVHVHVDDHRPHYYSQHTEFAHSALWCICGEVLLYTIAIALAGVCGGGGGGGRGGRREEGRERVY